MKIRSDFVTNSSSSSFVCIYEVNDCAEFREALKEKMGTVGLELADRYLKKGKDYYNDYELEIDDEKTYFQALHYTYSDDPDDFNQPANFLEDYMPKEYVTLLYESED
jgi:hypothetical protein